VIGSLIIDGVIGALVLIGMAWIIWDCAYAIALDWRCRAKFRREQDAARAALHPEGAKDGQS